MSEGEVFDVVIVGSGPNGLSAANALADAGLNVCVLEAKPTLGGGLRTEEITLPGFLHDRCSAVHPMGILSPYFRTLALENYGLEWCLPEASVAHPLENHPGLLLTRDLSETADRLGSDGPAYRRLMAPFVEGGPGLLADLLAPLQVPRHPFLMAQFGLLGLRSAKALAESKFQGEAAKALFGGCAAHSILPLDWSATAALGLIFSVTAHLQDWPVARGGSQSIASALVERFRKAGGETRVNHPVSSLSDIPESRYVIFDTSPAQLSSIAGDQLPAGYRKRLSRYMYGPGAFKLDWALSEPIPWKDPSWAKASTVHLGGTLAEINAAESQVWRGEHPEKPFVLLCQQSHMDDSRAPKGQHTGYAYSHVPSGSSYDMTQVIENQIERFAPGFRDTILARHQTKTADFQAHNRNYVGGAITGGAATLSQIFTRPVARLNPYTTPNPRFLIASASTPPGGGVHGMCGYYAAKTVLKRLGLPVPPLATDWNQLPLPTGE